MKAPMPKSPEGFSFAIDRRAGRRTFKAIAYRRAVNLGGYSRGVNPFVTYNPLLPQAVLRARLVETPDGTTIRASVGANLGTKAYWLACFFLIAVIMLAGLLSDAEPGQKGAKPVVIILGCLMGAIGLGFVGAQKAMLKPDEELLRAFVSDCFATMT